MNLDTIKELLKDKKKIAVGVGCIAGVMLIAAFAKTTSVPPNNPINPDSVTMESHAEKDVETHVTIPTASTAAPEATQATTADIPVPSIDPTTEATEATEAVITYPLDTSVPYEEAGKGIDTSALTGYQAKYPGLYTTPKEKVTPEEKTVYLTFDDGPSANTPLVLDELDKAGVKATFFVTPGGRDVETAKQRLIEIANRGHTIGIHTSSHQYKKIYASVDAFLADMDEINRFVYETTGIRPEIYRYPGGSLNSYNKPVAKEILLEMDRRGFTSFDWNSSTGDAEGKKYTSAELTKNALSTFGTKHRVIVLAHDGAGQKNTPGSIAGIVKYARDNGYTFGTLDTSCNEILFLKR